MGGKNSGRRKISPEKKRTVIKQIAWTPGEHARNLDYCARNNMTEIEMMRLAVKEKLDRELDLSRLDQILENVSRETI